MTIDEFLRNPGPLDRKEGTSFLLERDSLWDSVLVDFRLNLVSNTAQVLVQGMGLPPEYNTAVLVVYSVSECRISAPPPTGRSLRTVHSWDPHYIDNRWAVQVLTENALRPSGDEFFLAGSGAELYLGRTEIAGQPMPDFEFASDDEVAMGIVRWDSPFEAIALQSVGNIG
jgi:hypothetical protein